MQFFTPSSSIFSFFQRKYNRVSLQQQIQEHDDNHQRYLTERYKESDFTINYDNSCKQQDAEDKQNRLDYLKQFRDENKMVKTLSKYLSFLLLH